MKNFGYVIAALGTIAAAAPSIANAETVVIKHEDHMHRDHHWHHWHHHHHHDKKVVIIKHPS